MMQTMQAVSNVKVPWQCTVPQNFKLRPTREIFFDLVKACEGVYLFFYVRLSPDNILLIYWIKIDHVLLKIIMIDSSGSVHTARFNTNTAHHENMNVFEQFY